MAGFEEMTVKELIERLSDLDPELPMGIVYDGGAFRETMMVYATDRRALIEIPS